MHVQIIEPYFGGHHTNYLAALADGIKWQLAHGHLERATLTITSVHYEHLKKEGILKSIESAGVTVDHGFPVFSPAPSFSERYRLYKSIAQSVKAYQPDHLIVPSADYDVMMHGLCPWLYAFGKETAVQAIGIFHYGMPFIDASNLKEKLKQWIYQTSWRFSRWHKLMMVNPIVYESIIHEKSHLSKQVAMLPDPVPVGSALSKAEAREALGLPKYADLIGFIGMMDRRKAIPEALAAFDGIYQEQPNAILVLIGQLDAAYDQLIEDQYSHLVNLGKVIIMNRFLSQEEVLCAYRALDVVSLLQYRRPNLSANLLKAMMNDCYLIADDFGYTGMMVKRFGLGETCHVGDQSEIKASMMHALKSFSTHQHAHQVKRLKAFHSIQNFADTLLSNVTGVSRSRVVEWEWVCEGLVDSSSE